MPSLPGGEGVGRAPRCQRAGGQESARATGGGGRDEGLPLPGSPGAAAPTRRAAAAAELSSGPGGLRSRGVTSRGGWGQLLSSGCPQPAPSPAAARGCVPAFCVSDSAGGSGDTVASAASGAARRRGAHPPAGLGQERSEPRGREKSRGGRGAPRWVHLLLSPRLRVPLR